MKTKVALLNLPVNPELGAGLLRMALGTMWISHATLKYFIFTIPGFASWLSGQHLPSFMAWPVFLAELTGGLMILLGFHGRWASLLLMPVLTIAAWTHMGNGWVHTSPGGGWEYPVFLLIATIAHVFIGDGAFRISYLPAQYR